MKPAITFQWHSLAFKETPRQIRLRVREKTDRDELPPISQTVSELPYDSRIEVFLRELARAQRLQFYLRGVAQAGDLSHSAALLAWKAWKELSSAMADSLPVPDAGATPDGQLLFTWNNNEHHFELEVFSNGTGEFFYLNRSTDDVWEYDYQIGALLPDEVKDKLNLFIL